MNQKPYRDPQRGSLDERQRIEADRIQGPLHRMGEVMRPVICTTGHWPCGLWYNGSSSSPGTVLVGAEDPDGMLLKFKGNGAPPPGDDCTATYQWKIFQVFAVPAAPSTGAIWRTMSAISNVVGATGVTMYALNNPAALTYAGLNAAIGSSMATITCNCAYLYPVGGGIYSGYDLDTSGFTGERYMYSASSTTYGLAWALSGNCYISTLQTGQVNWVETRWVEAWVS